MNSYSLVLYKSSAILMVEILSTQYRVILPLCFLSQSMVYSSIGSPNARVTASQPCACTPYPPRVASNKRARVTVRDVNPRRSTSGQAVRSGALALDHPSCRSGGARRAKSPPARASYAPKVDERLTVHTLHLCVGGLFVLQQIQDRADQVLHRSGLIRIEHLPVRQVVRTAKASCL
jgi:hypothetical protein